MTAAPAFAVAQERSAEKVYLKDSIATLNFLQGLSLCDKIAYAENNVQDLVKSKGFSDLILQSIAKDSKIKIYIASINGNMVIKDQSLISELKVQLNKIKQNQSCP